MTLADLPGQQFASGSPKDLAEELGKDGKMNILRIICKAYNNLRVVGKVKSTMSEPEITEELFIELQAEWKGVDISLIPIHEKSHGRRKIGRGKTPTIDFCFRDRWDRHSYFGAECKLLEKDNNRFYKLYIAEGMNRYISGQYAEKCSTGLMIGYIMIGNTVEIINEIKNKIDELTNVSNMNKSDSINGFTDHYKSVHKREVGFSPFHLHHIFFSFT